jgi:uncharacterized protein YlxW (UPF0749 family)
VAQLLIDLVTDPRDPGYEAAARRRGDASARHWYDTPLVVLGCLLIGFVLVLAYVHTHRAAPETTKVHASLQARVHEANGRAARLSKQVRRLGDEVNAVRARDLRGAGNLTDRLDAEQLLAGQVAVTGPGLQVTLSEPPAPSATSQPGRAGTVPESATHILDDQDIRSVVNELWSDKAEAISVNGVRLTPTSAVRFAGQAVLVDFKPIASPYTIAAIGPPDDMDTAFAASSVAGRFQTLAGAEGIGFHFDTVDHLNLPASPAITTRYARVPHRARSGGGK